MKTDHREALCAAVAVFGLLVFTATASMPFPAAATCTLLLYFGVRLAIPAHPPADRYRVADGVTVAELNAVIRNRAAALASLQTLRRRVRDAALRDEVDRLCEALRELLHTLRKRPQYAPLCSADSAALAVTVRTLASQLNLPADAETRQALRPDVAAAVGDAADSVERVLDRVRADDVAAVRVGLSTSRAMRALEE